MPISRTRAARPLPSLLALLLGLTLAPRAVVAAAGPDGARRPAAAPVARGRGVALGLFSEDAGFSYRPLLDEIHATGADHVELVVALYLDDVHATAVHPHPRYSAPPAAIERAIGDARAAGLEVLLFPILRLERQHAPGEWRGTLSPLPRAAFFRSYGAQLVALARLAERGRVAMFSVGSELSSLDGVGDHAAWERVVAAVRAVYRGPLTYSGNWDRFEQVAIYDLVDIAGLCGYFPLSPARSERVDELLAAWQAVRARLVAFRERVRRPLVLTEVGYLSQRGASAWPWNEGAREPVDIADQARCYQAFRLAWSDAPSSLLAGVFFWNWYGWGGPRSGGYTPRNKPAQDEIRAFFHAPPR